MGATNDGALPARQTWYPERRRRDVRVFAVGSGVMAIAAVFAAVTYDGVSSLMFAVLFVLQSVNFGYQARFRARSCLEADAAGLHHVIGGQRLSYPWGDITEIRPSIAKGRHHTHLVAVRERGMTVDLPVTEEHLEELRRWHAAST